MSKREPIRIIIAIMILLPVSLVVGYFLVFKMTKTKNPKGNSDKPAILIMPFENQTGKRIMNISI